MGKEKTKGLREYIDEAKSRLYDWASESPDRWKALIAEQRTKPSWEENQRMTNILLADEVGSNDPAALQGAGEELISRITDTMNPVSAGLAGIIKSTKGKNLKELFKGVHIEPSQVEKRLSRIQGMIDDPERAALMGEKATVVEMGTDDYFSKSAKGFNRLDQEIYKGTGRQSPVVTTPESLLEGRDYGKMIDYATTMGKKKGKKFPTPMLDYSGQYNNPFSQEGLHRAAAAEMGGQGESIPVVMVSKTRRKDRRPRSSAEHKLYLAEKKKKKEKLLKQLKDLDLDD